MVCQLIMYSNVIVGITISRGSFVFSQSRVKVSASLTNAGSLAVDKNYSLDSEDDFRSGCRNVSHQQQFFSELPSPGRSHYTNFGSII